jgi:hypothetical protein
MMATDVEAMNQDNVIQFASRVSVRAVLSGFVVAAALVLLTTVLGAAIFLSGLSPTASSIKGMTIGFYVWTLVFFIVSVFCGAFVAASASQSLVRRNGVLHGVLVWGLLALGTASLLGGVMTGTLGSALSFGSTAVGAAAQSSALNTQVQKAGVQREVGKAVRQAARGANPKEMASTAASIGGLSMWAFFLLLVLPLISSIVGGAAAIGYEARTVRKHAIQTTTERPPPRTPVYTPPQPAT